MDEVPELFHYRRNAPHWRMKGATYFVTWRINEQQTDLSAAERDIVSECLLHFNAKRYMQYAYVVMNDHVHCLVRPLPGRELQTMIHTWKSFTAHRLQLEQGRQGAVWQREYTDRIMRSEEEFWQKVNYILNNPRKRWPEITEYRWIGWFKNWETDRT